MKRKSKKKLPFLREVLRIIKNNTYFLKKSLTKSLGTISSLKE